jgi:hypothetical protein
MNEESVSTVPADKTRGTLARVVGLTIFFYIAISIVGGDVFGRITAGHTTAARLGNIARHGPEMGLSFVLALLTVFAALIVAVALYALVRDEDANLALFALTCRLVESVLNATVAVAMLALLSVAMQAARPGSDVGTLDGLGSFLLKFQGWSTIVSAPVFGVGSGLFYYLFARARSIPAPLAWFGVLSSALLVLTIPLQGLQIIKGPIALYVWLPSLIFELIFAPWLLIKGVARNS